MNVPSQIQQFLSGEYALLVAVIPVVLAWIGTVAVNFANAHLKNQQVRTFVAQAVKYAQQAIPDKSARYDMVAHLVSSKFPSLSVSDVKVVIEAGVLDLKTTLAGVGTALAAPAPALSAPVLMTTNAAHVPAWTTTSLPDPPPTVTPASAPALLVAPSPSPIPSPAAAAEDAAALSQPPPLAPTPIPPISTDPSLHHPV